LSLLRGTEGSNPSLSASPVFATVHKCSKSDRFPRYLSVGPIPKRLELLCELVPKAAVIAQLMGPNSEVAQQLVRTTQEAARAKDIQLVVLNATTETEIDAAFEQLHADALLVQATPFLASRRDQLVALAARYAVPAIYFDRRSGRRRRPDRLWR
jgi:hypothetical protein